MKLNKIERLKKELKPFEFNIEDINFNNLDDRARFYLKSYGIYNISINPDTFMLRLRFDTGIISKETLRTIYKIVKDFSLKVTITARAQIEIHNILPNDILNIYNYLKSSDIVMLQTLTDNFRAVTTEPLTNLASTKIDTVKIINSITKEFISDSDYFGMLPRKFNSSIIGTEFATFNPWGSDLLMLLSKKESKVGFNLYLGGKNSEVAKSIDIFIEEDMAKKLFFAVAKLYLNKGFRGSRSKCRVHFLVKELGVKEIKKELESIVGDSLATEGRLLVEFTKDIVVKLNIKSYGAYGELSLDNLQQAIGSNREIFRLTPNQELLAISNSSENKSFNPSNIISCVGSKYCKLSLWNIKEDIEPLLLNKLAKASITIGFSGCLKGCGKHHMSDIGLIGLRTNLYGKTERALRVYIGGVSNYNSSPARLIYYSVPRHFINPLLDTIINIYNKSGYKSFEEFSYKVLNRYNIEFLQLFFISYQLYNISDDILMLFFNLEDKTILDRLIEIDSIFNNEIPNITNTITHILWDSKNS